MPPKPKSDEERPGSATMNTPDATTRPDQTGTANPGSLHPVVRHCLVTETPHRPKWQRRDNWKQSSHRVMEDWEWRLLLQISWLKLERRAEIIEMVATEAADAIIPKEIEAPLRDKARSAIIEQAKRDIMPNSDYTTAGRIFK